LKRIFICRVICIHGIYAVKSFFSPKHSLSARLLEALAAMLVPLLILGAGSYFSFQLLSSSLNEVVEEALGEMAPLTELQLLLQETRISLHRAVQEVDPGAPRRLAELVEDTDKAFARGSELPFTNPEKKKRFKAAWREWQQGRQNIGEILPMPEGKPFAAPSLRIFEEHVSRAVLLLKEAHILAEAEILEQLSAVDATKRNISRLNTVLFLIGMAMVAGIGLLLTRSILRPLRQLESGVRRFASGDFSYRIASQREDELGGLTRAFNTMAQELAKERQALQELSVRDPLTGLFNHREFYRLLREELERACRYCHPLSVLMLDLDCFKKVNDTYGHQAGDHALTAVTGLLVRELRRVDEIARYGGEEFAIILPETSGAEAVIFADRIRQAVAARPVPVSTTEEINLTVSIGLAVYPHDADTGDDLVNLADKALYRAKNEGRNRVCRSRAAGRGEANETGMSVLNRH
jgi:diguanylate cyclase (GGDEF)-like protein